MAAQSGLRVLVTGPAREMQMSGTRSTEEERTEEERTEDKRTEDKRPVSFRSRVRRLFPRGTEDLRLGAIWQIGLVALALVLSFTVIVLFSMPLRGSAWWSAVGALIAYAAAAQAAGAALGFLFGVPRSRVYVTRTKGEEAQTLERVGEPSISQASNAPNTNLEQISDWLTKILVGVGLTQAGAIWSGFLGIVDEMAAGIAVPNAAPFTASLLVFAAAIGFLAGWVLARVWLARLLAASDQSLDRLGRHA